MAAACAPQQKKSPQGEALAPQLESNPHSLQLEKARAQQQRPSTDNNKQINNLKKKTVPNSIDNTPCYSLLFKNLTI